MTAARAAYRRESWRVASSPAIAPIDATSRMSVTSQLSALLRSKAWAAQFSGIASRTTRAITMALPCQKAERPAAIQVVLVDEAGHAGTRLASSTVGGVHAPPHLVLVGIGAHRFLMLLSRGRVVAKPLGYAGHGQLLGVRAVLGWRDPPAR